MGGTRSDVARVCGAIERYFDALRGAGFRLYDAALKPQSAAAITGLETALGVELPADARVFFGRGLRAATGSIEDGDRFASIGFNWLDVSFAIRHTSMLRGVADGGDHGAVIDRGVALTYEEPELVLAGSVWHFSFRNPLLEVAGSLTEFLECWLEAGCFASHDVDLVRERTSGLTPTRMVRNRWIEAYRSQFPG